MQHEVTPVEKLNGARVAIYVLLTQAGWFACVLTGAHGMGWIGSAFVVSVVGLHMLWSRDKKAEAVLLVLVTGLGWAWESVMALTNTLRYAGDPVVAPHWMAALWALFAIQLNTLFRWLRGRWAIAALMGAIAGPLAFRAGSMLGAVSFPDIAVGLLVLSAGWLFIFPGMIFLASRFDGVFPPPSVGSRHGDT